MNQNFISKKRLRKNNKHNDIKTKMNLFPNILESSELNNKENPLNNISITKKFNYEYNKLSRRKKLSNLPTTPNLKNIKNFKPENKKIQSSKIEENNLPTEKNFYFLNPPSKNYELKTNPQIKKKSINLDCIKHKNLKYEVESWSSYISNFHPKNICLDSKTSGQFSKWSVDFKSQNEFIYLKLEKTSIIYMITFGKFRDPTNLKEFKIFAGMDKNNMIEILHSGLSYDMEYEPFTVRKEYKGNLIPCNYLKLIPIRPWDDNYNISVWFINLKGIDDPKITSQVECEFKITKDRETKLNWIKLSREIFKENSCEIFRLKEMNYLLNTLEDTNITQLFHFIMLGNYQASLEILKTFVKRDAFSNYIRDIPYKVYIKRLDFLSEEINFLFSKLRYSFKQEKKIVRETSYSNNEFFENSINSVSSNFSNLGILHNENNINVNNNQENQVNPVNQLSLINNNTDNNIRNNTNNINNLEENDNILNNDLYNFEIDELKIDSLLSQNYDLENNSNFLAESNSNEENILSVNQINYPCGRGGHAMVLDESNSIVYLFGGWDGTKDLDDFWMFEIVSEEWKLISLSTQCDKGPSPRSCHKMVLDNKYQKIYVYGKLKNSFEEKDIDLYEYSIKNNLWIRHCISEKYIESGVNIVVKGGPGQVHDHQMCIDSDKQIIFIFGGIVIPDIDDVYNGKYLGLWSLDLKTFVWDNLLNEKATDIYNIKLKTRTGHSMVFDPINQELIIFGGQKISKKKNESTSQLFDIMVYNTNTKNLREIYHDYSREKGPDVNFSLNSYFNHNTREIIFFGGALKNDKQDIVSNNIWILNLITKSWNKLKKSDIVINYDAIMQEDINLYYADNKYIYNNLKNFTMNNNEDLECLNYNKINSVFRYNLSRNTNLLNFQDSQLNEPMARYAHTMVYSLKFNKGYIFGGNQNIKSNHSIRLNDMWSFEFIKPNTKEIKNILKGKILKLSFIESLSESKFENALKIVGKLKKLNNFDKNDLKSLSDSLIKSDYSNIKQDDLYKYRFDLFDDITKYINEFLS